MLGELTEKQIKLVLETQILGHLGCFANGKIYVVPISFAYNDDYIYSQTNEGLKSEMMISNPSVCFQAEIIDSMNDWRSVICWGQVQFLNENNSIKEALDILSERFNPIITSKAGAATIKGIHRPPEFVQKPIKTKLFRIKLTEKTGRFEKREV